MTPSDKKASEMANNFKPFNYGNSEEEQRDAFIEGFKAALELEEVKGMEEALKLYAPHGLNANEALTAWKKFRGEGA
ncbi:MAG: hypothetical protein OM95_07040 [Bdellovibrio sp. ArHS]|uniref:hypothetical protein n=1 Tax=Bdellovibrio sp. ArHS TaxID=1569284 RepID=UPI000582A0F9|nr:hypothetical protein [Bdellovibrio sp. ArHS]KHD88864.1 MAG: hypothetical protein OM95_07040 [Bdellovibrio sp. ArHS]